MNATGQLTSTPRSLHTPGPWKAFKPLDSNGYVYVQSESGEEVCTCYYYKDADANARFIAEAPELLAACKELREAVAACFRVIDRQGQAAVTDLERELSIAGIADGFGKRAQLLIAKAEGASSVLKSNEVL